MPDENTPTAQPGRETTTLSDPLESILRDAISQRATDVHLDPFEGGKLVRYRIDGVLYEKEALSLDQGRRVKNQIKITAGMSIDRAFRPEEGQIALTHNERSYDIRVTIVPVAQREALHLRFFSATEQLRDLEELGLRDEDVGTIRSIVESGAGLIVVAGPTGAGKTTTLYALARSLDLSKNVAVTIEDPVEFRLRGVRQLQVNERHDLTMYQGLRALLRMDPDAIIVGEIRDKASAVTAFRAGLAGRLVIATLHARDAAMAVAAMHNLAIPDYIIAGALRLIITQDLVRRVCPHCSEDTELDEETLALFERWRLETPDHIHRVARCPECQEYGYVGRTGVFELTPIGRQVRDAIAAGRHGAKLRELLKPADRHSLARDALMKVAEGVTSLDEVRRFLDDDADG